jgi:hypothetical protein
MDEHPFLEKLGQARVEAEQLRDEARAYITHGQQLEARAMTKLSDLDHAERVYLEVNGLPLAEAASGPVTAAMKSAGWMMNDGRLVSDRTARAQLIHRSFKPEVVTPGKFYGGGEAVVIADASGAVLVQPAAELERMSLTRRVVATCQNLMSRGDFFTTEEILEQLKNRNIEVSTHRLSQILSTADTFTHQRGKGWGLIPPVLQAMQKFQWDDVMRRNAKRVNEELDRNKP